MTRENRTDQSVSLQISPTWDVFGGNPQWRALIMFDEKVAFFAQADTIERAITDLALQLAKNIKSHLDSARQEDEQRRLEESR